MGSEIQNTNATGGYISPSSTRRATLQRFSRSEPRGGASVVTWDMPVGGATTATNHGTPRAPADTGCRENNRLHNPSGSTFFGNRPTNLRTVRARDRCNSSRARARASTLI